MHTSPAIKYSGLTFILDEPSRFDKDYNRLLSGPSRDYLDRDCFPSGYSVDSCDICTLDYEGPILPDTRAIFLAGEETAKVFGAFTDPPGYVSIAKGLPALPIFFPQDCVDYKNLRGNDDEYEEATTDRDTKEKMPTRRKNWRFWNSWHIRKFLLGRTPVAPAIDIRSYPRIDEALRVLNELKENEELFLDIETSRIHRCLTCVGFTTRRAFPKIFVVPVFLSTGDIAYRDYVLFHRGLSLALARAEVVIHNSMFDLLVLHAFYKTCLPSKVYDTMVGQHRCFPEAEKSLAHAISSWTNQPYHKDLNTDVYNHEGEKRLWDYNARDVFNLVLIKDAQLAYAKTVPGLAESIKQGNESIIPYLVTSINGLHLDTLKLANVHAKLEARKILYAKIASILVGKPFNPGSSKQCGDFFHKTLNYPVVSRTAQGAPALGSKQLYQLQLKHNNPLVPVILKYREVSKDASSLETELFTLP